MRKNFAVERIAIALLIFLAGALWSAAPALSQIKNSGTKSEAVNLGDGTRGKSITTYTNYQNGDETVEKVVFNDRGKRVTSGLDLIKPSGERTMRTELYDRNGQHASTTSTAYDASGTFVRFQYETYQNGLLASGNLSEYDENGALRSHKKYNASTERYEDAPIEDFPGIKVTQISPVPVTETKSKGPTNIKQSRGGNEEVFEAWWQFFSNDKEGLDNLKLAILDCDPDLRKAVEKWLDAAKAAGEQNRKAVKARNAVRPTIHRAQLAKDEAAKATPAEKEAKEKAAAKAQEAADAARKAAADESKKEIQANDALKEAEKNVDPNVRKTVSEAAEKELQKAKQERADEKPNMTQPQKTKQERVDDRANTKQPRCPPKTAKGPAKMDPCLVGQWLATSVTPLNKAAAGATGGTGYRVTFTSDGTQSIDYSATTTLVFPDSTPAALDTFTYRGTASARISTENGAAKIEGIEKQAATATIAAVGRTFVQKINGLGPGGLGSTASDNGYTCARDSLEYRASDAVDKHPTYAIKLNRQK